MMEIHLIKYTGKLRKPLIEKNSSNLSISNFFFENVEYFHEIFACQKIWEDSHNKFRENDVFICKITK